jgi:hypothetical protein
MLPGASMSSTGLYPRQASQVIAVGNRKNATTKRERERERVARYNQRTLSDEIMRSQMKRNIERRHVHQRGMQQLVGRPKVRPIPG